MSSPYINVELRRLVASRSDYLCEYCLIPEADGFRLRSTLSRRELSAVETRFTGTLFSRKSLTARILDFNGDERTIERQALIASGQYPSASALKRINK
ncbi:hypothetical protein WKK05_02695 [Nostoc sp. UHCC 0302]|uniref:hypothetical protein n=1 Tax=Nostoc sp. UHCC 0302 TaxID=3134896 RepID=UPI00311CC043